MNFLYVILGMAMISGISAMMKIGNNINNLMLLSTFKENCHFFLQEDHGLCTYFKHHKQKIYYFSSFANRVNYSITGQFVK